MYFYVWLDNIKEKLSDRIVIMWSDGSELEYLCVTIRINCNKCNLHTIYIFQVKQNENIKTFISLGHNCPIKQITSLNETKEQKLTKKLGENLEKNTQIYSLFISFTQ